MAEDVQTISVGQSLVFGNPYPILKTMNNLPDFIKDSIIKHLQTMQRMHVMNAEMYDEVLLDNPNDKVQIRRQQEWLESADEISKAIEVFKQ